jgi:3'5'-cyclic nucleotide phosphodiesterase
MASFAIVFSALIHDVDHVGCSNVQLAKEQPSLGLRYRNQSIAEQNSIDISWDLLMESRFDNLRRVIFGNQEGLMRFRQFIVNLVLATDIFDKELNDLRKQRWIKAFSENNDLSCPREQADRKATIVIVHLMQASDVSHTMQHWQVYRKWNKLLFQEMYSAYKAGRMGVNPSEFWYEGEIKFFDNYIIPLANKLKECNVFGVSSDEYLNYAGKCPHSSRILLLFTISLIHYFTLFCFPFQTQSVIVLNGKHKGNTSLKK